MSEIVIYDSGEDAPSLFVQVDKDTVWLTLDRMTELFQRNKSTISRHIQNIFNDGELDEESVVAKNATTEARQYFLCCYGNDCCSKTERKSSNDRVGNELPHHEAR